MHGGGRIPDRSRARERGGAGGARLVVAVSVYSRRGAPDRWRPRGGRAARSRAGTARVSTPQEPDAPDRPARAIRALALGLSLALVTVVAVALDYTVDDAFISFRYADNLRHGHGLTFN